MNYDKADMNYNKVVAKVPNPGMKPSNAMRTHAMHSAIDNMMSRVERLGLSEEDSRHVHISTVQIRLIEGANSEIVANATAKLVISIEGVGRSS